MNHKPRLPISPLIGLTVGGTFVAAGLAMLICAGVGFVEGRAGFEFAVPGIGTVVLGVYLAGDSITSGRRNVTVRPVVGFAAVTLAWVLGAAAGAIPLLAAGTFHSTIDAYFEAVSGFTTTGATLVGDIEAQPDAVLLWRSMMQWLGGIGIIVLVVAVAPVSGPGLQRAFYAETSGMPSDRLTPRIIDTAKIISAVYLALSAIAAAAYLTAGMNPFDAINHSMTTIATGGFSTKNMSIGAFDSTAIEGVAIVFMFLGGINFAFYWKAIRGKEIQPQAGEVLAYGILLLLISALVGLSLLLNDEIEGFGATIVDSLFSVTTVLTTTGFTTADFDQWNPLAKALIFTTMFFGACAGSTSGGMKIIRVLLLGKVFRQEIQRQLKPNAVQVLRIGRHVFRESTRQAVLGFFLVYILIYAAGVLVMAAAGLDLESAASAAASTLNLIGPGLAEIGAAENFQAMSDLGRVASCFLMIAGRLEVFTVVALLAAVVRRTGEMKLR